MKKIAFSVVLISLLSACASDKPAEVAQAPAPAPQEAAPAPAAAPQEAQAAAPVATDALEDPNSILSKRSAFFDFDKSIVKDDDKPMVQAHGQYMKEHGDRAVEVQGNCDERGSSEYNLALGQRRADAVKKMLVVSGAGAKQVSTVSFGEEKPRASGHNEEAWSQNRRADIVYK